MAMLGAVGAKTLTTGNTVALGTSNLTQHMPDSSMLMR